MQSLRNWSHGRRARSRAVSATRRSQIDNLRLSGSLFNHLPNAVEGFVQPLKSLGNEPNFFWRDNQHHANSEIEGSPEILVGYTADTLQELENGLFRPCFWVHFNCAGTRKNARDVVSQTTAGNVRGAFQQPRIVERLDGMQIGFVGLQQFVSDGEGKIRKLLVYAVAGSFKEEFTSEGIAIGMQALRRKTEQEIAWLDVFAGEHLAALYRAHDEACQVIFAGSIHAWHFSRFTANQGAAIPFTSARDALHDASAHRRIELGNGKIVEEEKRFSTLDGDVIDTMIHQVFADSIVAAGGKSDFEFGSHSIGGTDQNRIVPAFE